MKCYVVFNFDKDGKEQISIPLNDGIDSYDKVTDKEILNALQNKNNSNILEQLKNKIRDKINNITLASMDIEQAAKVKGYIIGNDTFQGLCQRMGRTIETDQDGNIPEYLRNVQILYGSRLNVCKKDIRGRMINSNGQEIFVITGQKEVYKELNNLENFLKLKYILENKQDALKEEDKKDLEKIIYKKKGQSSNITNETSLLLYYLEHKEDKRLKSQYITNSEGENELIQNVLYRIYNNLLEEHPKIVYKSTTINTIVNNGYAKHIMLNRKDNTKQKKTSTDLFISIGDLYTLANTHFATKDGNNLFDTFKIRRKGKSKIIKPKKEGEQSIEKDLVEFDDFFNKSYNDLTPVTKTTLTKFLKGYNLKITDENRDTPLWHILWELLVQGDPDYDFEFNGVYKEGDNIKVNGREYQVSTKGSFVRLKKKWSTLADRGFNYETVYAFDHQELYRGYNIYKRKNDKNQDEYYISKGIINDNSLAKEFDNIDDAKKFIDNNNNNDTFDRSMLSFKHGLGVIVKSETLTIEEPAIGNLKEGSIIQHINIAVNKNQQIIQGEQQFTASDSKEKLSDFYEYIKNQTSFSQNIKVQIYENIDTIEKAVLFLYLLNAETQERTTAQNQNVENIIKQINSADIEYLYIQQREKHGSKYHYVVYPVNGSNINAGHAYTREMPKRLPAIQFINIVARVLNSQFGIEVKILSEQEIKREVKVKGIEQHKAFIYQGQIYINSSRATAKDVLHEYTHLILQVLKSVNPQGYTQLMQKTYSLAGEKKIKNFHEQYPELSMYDVVEEYFCNAFSGWVVGNKISRQSVANEDTLFMDDSLVDVTQKLFNRKIIDQDDFKELFKGQRGNFFTMFSQQVRVYMQENKKMSFNGRNKDTLKQMRIKTNWIGKQIQKYNDANKDKIQGEKKIGIKEECK